MIARLEVFKETKNYVLLWFYQISIKRQRFWVTYFFHYSWFRFSTGDSGALVQLVSLLRNFIQQNLNSGSAQVQHLLAPQAGVGDLQWWESLIKISAENKTKRLSSFNYSANQLIIIIIIIFKINYVLKT